MFWLLLLVVVVLLLHLGMSPEDLASSSDGYSCGVHSILLLPLLLQFLNVCLFIFSKIFIDDPYMTSRCTAVCATEIRCCWWCCCCCIYE